MPSPPTFRISGVAGALESVEVGASEAERIRNRILGAGSVDAGIPPTGAPRG